MAQRVDRRLPHRRRAVPHRQPSRRSTCPARRSPIGAPAPSTDPDVQRLRRFLGYEPRGHADMYGGFVVPPDDDGAHLGVLFWHKDGFSTACGHGTIALGVWAVDTRARQPP